MCQLLNEFAAVEAAVEVSTSGHYSRAASTRGNTVSAFPKLFLLPLLFHCLGNK